MKLIITGQPKSGKSTLLTKVLEHTQAKKGFVTKEVSQNGHRTGFVVEDSSGRSAVLAQTDTPTDYMVGRYYVETSVVDTLIEDLHSFQNDELLYIDEIGQMQLHLEKFRTLLKVYLDAPNDCMATITNVYQDVLTKEILARRDTITFHLNAANREVIEECLRTVLHNRQHFNNLPKKLQAHTINYANHYLTAGAYTSFNKLFNNALIYFLDKKVRTRSSTSFVVKGNKSDHTVQYRSEHDWSCDCPLSKGKKPFAKPGDCSHFQAVRLFIEQKNTA